MATSTLAPMEVFIQDMESESIDARIKAIKNIQSIAKALGPVRTEKELIPFLIENKNDEDQVFYEIAKQISDMTKYLSDKKHAMCLIPLLDLVMSMEEVFIRNEAIEAFQSIVKQVDQQVIEESFLPMVIKLSKSEWFPHKMCACQNIGFLYEYVSHKGKLQLIQALIDLTKADMPIVRRNATNYFASNATNLYNTPFELTMEQEKLFSEMSQFIETTNAFLVYHYLFPTLEHLVEDDQDTLRVLATEELYKIYSLIGKEFTVQGQEKFLLPIVIRLLNDNSWRVRTVCTMAIIKFQDIFAPEIFENIAKRKFIEYLDDVEIEVRVRATQNLAEFVDKIPEAHRRSFIIESLIPKIDTLMNSKNIQLKTALSTNIICIAKHISLSEMKTHLLNYYMNLLRDDNSDISLATISQLCDKTCADNICLQELSSSIFDSISELIKDPKWRVRNDVVPLLPMIASVLGFDCVESDQLISTLIEMFNDSVYEVRKSASLAVQNLVMQQGIAYAQNKIIPAIFALKNNPYYMLRQVYFDNLDLLIQFFSTPDVLKLYQNVRSMVKDKVANIRFRLLRFYNETLYPRLINSKECKSECESVMTSIYEEVEGMLGDDEPDVVDFAKDFLQNHGK